jgi:ethylene-insensitive protein 3
MSAKESETWSKVLRQEEALSSRLRNSLRITPLDQEEEDEEVEKKGEEDDGLGGVVRGAQDKRKREIARSSSSSGKCPRPTGGNPSELTIVLPDQLAAASTEQSRSPIDELMKLYFSCIQGGESYDGRGKDDMALMPPVVLDGVDEVAQDVLFDIIGSCPEVEDMLRLMGEWD